MEHHHHHHIHLSLPPTSDEILARLADVKNSLADILMRLDMIDPVVQAAMNEARQAKDVLVAMDAAFKGMVTQIGVLQQTVANLQAGAILTDADKTEISTQTSDLATVVSNAQADITANTGQQTPTQQAQGTNDPGTAQGGPASGGASTQT